MPKLRITSNANAPEESADTSADSSGAARRKLNLNLSSKPSPSEAPLAAPAPTKERRKKSGGKTERFEVRMTPAEAKLLDKSAKSAGLSRSDYVRSLIDGRTVQLVQVNVDAKRFDDLLHELKKSGTNLNQIAYRLNSRGDIDLAEFARAVERHKQAASAVTEFIDEIRPVR